jgi:hypothetical protein
MGVDGPHREGEAPKPMMDAGEKSVPAIVAMKPTNNAGDRLRSGGAKGGDRGECGPATHAPGAGPGKRVPGAGAHTASRKAQTEGTTVHRALPPSQPGDAADGVLRSQARGRPWRGWVDVAGLRRELRSSDRGPARKAPSGSVPGVAITTKLRSRKRMAASARWRWPPSRTRSSRG